MEIEQLRKRREERRRSVKRRRRLVACLSAGVAVLVAVAVMLTGSSGGSSSKRPAAAVAKRTHAVNAARTTVAATGARGSARAGPPGTDPVPILMYHVIAAPPAGAPFPGLYVEPAEFAEQMQALRSAGWHAVTLDQLEAHWTRGASLGPGKPIVITFDGGDRKSVV